MFKFSVRPLIAMVLLVCTTVAAAQSQTCSPILDRSLRPLAGKTPESLCQFQGKVLLMVNVASKCGFTPQYERLEALHARLAPQGFAVLGFPSNDFLGQEPGSEQEIKDFCTLTYGVKFPMYEKMHVKGDQANPLYQQLREATGEAPGWNFHKYLVDRNGAVVASFGSRTKPDDARLLEQIQSLLDAKTKPTATKP